MVSFVRCCICEKESTTLIGLRAHLRVHETRQSPQKNVCNVCNKSFFGKHHLNRHMKLIHGLGNFNFFLNHTSFMDKLLKKNLFHSYWTKEEFECN